MIDVQPYLDKLEILKDYLAYNIDRRNWMDYTFTFYDTTGMLPFTSGHFFYQSFEEYFNANQVRTELIANDTPTTNTNHCN